MLSQFRFQKINSEVAYHPVEQRGFVTVPFDLSQPKGDTIEVFYRLLPAHHTNPEDSKKPIIVVINGGPGIPSSFYRPLDFDYQNPNSPANGSLDRFMFFLKTHRILLVDQRGTPGQTAPLNMDNPEQNAALVAKYFSSDSQAHDILAVIEKIIPREDEFYIIAQSYGGMVGMQYLSLPNARKPKGIVFSSSGLPYEDTLESYQSRRKEQLKLNHHLLQVVPTIKEKIFQVRGHLRSLGLDPNQVNSLYTLLGKNVAGVWEKDLVTCLDKMLQKDRGTIQKDFQKDMASFNLLNYILSYANFGEFTDRMLAKITSEQIPFEPWMIDENWVLTQAGEKGTWLNQFVDNFDSNPPPTTPFSNPTELRAAIAHNQLLFTVADNDAFVPAESYLQSIKKYQVEGHTQIKLLPGGHHAIFLEKGHQEFLSWSTGLD